MADTVDAADAAVQTTPDAPTDGRPAVPVVSGPLSDAGNDDEDSDDDPEYDVSDSESVSSDTSAVTLEEEGMITHLFESSYVGPNVLPKYHSRINPLDYDRCSSRELKSFVKARGLIDPFPQGLTLKWFYLRVLEQADKTIRPFRFMDLPPEMRDMVYVELLTLPKRTCPKHCFCFPQILCVNRVIHDEAVSVLYGENEIYVAFAAAPTFRTHSEKYVRIHTSFHEDGESDPFGSVAWGMSVFPDFLRRVNKLFISISLDFDLLDDFTVDPDHAAGWLARCLLNLSSFLMDNHRLKTLRVVAYSDDTYDDLHAEVGLYPLRCLYPLQRIRNVMSVEIMGIAPEQVAGTVSDMQGSTPVFNTLQMFVLLRDEARAYLRLEDHIISNPTTATMPGPRRSARFAHETNASAMTRLIGEIERKLRPAGITSLLAENEVLDLIAELQGHFDVCVGQTELTRKIDLLCAATKRRAKYTEGHSGIKNPRATRGTPAT